MQNIPDGSNPKVLVRAPHNHPTLLWSAIGLMLGALFGNQTGRGVWQAEIEWGVVGLLLGFSIAYAMPYVSQFKQPLLTRITVTMAITLLSLSGWLTLCQFLLASFPILQHSLLLLGFLFFPQFAWHITNQFTLIPHVSKTIERATPQAQTLRISESPRLLDSSAIIDGRILSLCKTGFIQGRLLVPKCILQELQFLADSPQSDKRVRGKRGLEVLTQLRTLPSITILIPEEDTPQNLPVDEQLLKLAQTLQGIIITNDWNLAQIANLQGLMTLNINELTYELRPLILPGQSIRVFVQKEGQGPGQGAAHLDDGTLVIIDHGRSAIGQIVDVHVTRYMQTNTGRMIFASLVETLAQDKSSAGAQKLDTAGAA